MEVLRANLRTNRCSTVDKEAMGSLGISSNEIIVRFKNGVDVVTA